MGDHKRLKKKKKIGKYFEKEEQMREMFLNSIYLNKLLLNVTSHTKKTPFIRQLQVFEPR